MSRKKNDWTGFVKVREKINHVTNDYKDADTGDFITGLMEAHEKMAWMLRYS